MKIDENQFMASADKIYGYAQRLEKQGFDGDVIATAMLHTVLFYIIKSVGREDAAKWVSEQVNTALEEMRKRNDK